MEPCVVRTFECTKHMSLLHKYRRRVRLNAIIDVTPVWKHPRQGQGMLLLRHLCLTSPMNGRGEMRTTINIVRRHFSVSSHPASPISAKTMSMYKRPNTERAINQRFAITWPRRRTRAPNTSNTCAAHSWNQKDCPQYQSRDISYAYPSVESQIGVNMQIVCYTGIGTAPSYNVSDCSHGGREWMRCLKRVPGTAFE